jgi:hypothetical protein
LAFVYHIHLPEYSGCVDRGYIGFTSNTVDHRFREHKGIATTEKCPNYPVYNALRKYGDRVVVTTLIEGSNEYCLDMERRLRPTPNMGWNIACGGGAPMLGLRHAEGAFDNAFPPERRKKQSDFAKSVPTWLHGSSDKVIWASADRVYDCFKAHEPIGANLLGQALGLGIKQAEAIRNKFLKGWVPTEDSEWVNWSGQQESKLQGGWRAGDALVERAKPELTDELRVARGLGGKNRVWTEEAKESLRRLNIGRKHRPETLLKMSESRKGVPKTDEDKAAISLRLRENPWTNATALHENWARSMYILESLTSGKTVADLLREFGIPRRSGALCKIVKKIKSGWIPATDERYQLWLTEYNKTKELYESALPT